MLTSALAPSIPLPGNVLEVHVLVLTRRSNQQIVINGDIVVTVIETARGQVRLGFSAPAGCRICRRESFTGPLPVEVADPIGDPTSRATLPTAT